MIYRAQYRLINDRKYIIKVFFLENDNEELKDSYEISLTEEIYNYFILNKNFKFGSFNGNTTTRFYIDSEKTSIEDTSEIFYDLSVDTLLDETEILDDTDDTDNIYDILSVFSHRFFRFFSKSLFLLYDTQDLYKKLAAKNIFITDANKETIMENIVEEGDSETISDVVDYITKNEKCKLLIEDHKTIYDKLGIINTTRDIDVITKNAKDIKNVVLKRVTSDIQE